MNRLKPSNRLIKPFSGGYTPGSRRGMAPNLRQRAIVSSFICTPPTPTSGFTFALFKRSNEVSPYPGKWAVCSGSIENSDASPEEAAKREILEETTLSNTDIFLLRKGKSFNLVDEALKTKWTIHSFAWQLKERAKPIKLDHEHTEYCFIRPVELTRMDHVPQLDIGLSRILVTPSLERELAALRDDHQRGAQALALKALEFLLKFARSQELAIFSTSGEFWKEIRCRAWHLAKNGNSSMCTAVEEALFEPLENVRNTSLVSPSGINGIQLPLLKGMTEASIEGAIETRTMSLKRRATKQAPEALRTRLQSIEVGQLEKRLFEDL